MVDSEPDINNEALKMRVWVNSIKEEFEEIERNKTWEFIILPQNKKSISERWIFKIKLKPYNLVAKHKAWLVTTGFLQKYGLYYFKLFAPVARHETIRLFIAVAANRN